MSKQKTPWDLLSILSPTYFEKCQTYGKIGRIVQQMPICQDSPIVIFTHFLSFTFTYMYNKWV